MAKKKKKAKWDIDKESKVPSFKSIKGLPRYEIARNGAVRRVEDNTYCSTYLFVDGLSVKLQDSKGYRGDYYVEELLRHCYES